MQNSNPLNPETLRGVTFFDNASKRTMRYISPDAEHGLAGWIVVRKPDGEWMTLRKATDADIAAISGATLHAAMNWIRGDL